MVIFNMFNHQIDFSKCWWVQRNNSMYIHRLSIYIYTPYINYILTGAGLLALRGVHTATPACGGRVARDAGAAALFGHWFG